nr:MAG TPA: dUTPase [Caudoviricetes sp.]
METIKFAKVKENAIIPTKTDENMGYDIYACFDEDYIEIRPQETKLIPTGIASCCSDDYGFIIKERGSTGSQGIAVRCDVIDSGFRGEWFIALTNTTKQTIRITKKVDKVQQGVAYSGKEEKYYLGTNKNVDFVQNDPFVYGETLKLYPYNKAIAQAILVPVPKVKVEEVTYDEIKAIKSKRMNGQLGSSGK